MFSNQEFFNASHAKEMDVFIKETAKTDPELAKKYAEALDCLNFMYESFPLGDDAVMTLLKFLIKNPLPLEYKLLAIIAELRMVICGLMDEKFKLQLAKEKFSKPN